MDNIEAAVARLLPPLSSILGKELVMATPSARDASQAFVMRGVVPTIGIVTANGETLNPVERRAIDGVLGLAQAARDSQAHYLELEQRMVALQRENIELSVRNRTLDELCSKDVLTGLYNRAYIVEKLDSEINRAFRHGSPMALLMIDIDHFKQINDNYGHPAGDQVLQRVGQILRESCRVYDIPGRYGGEEFCVVLPQTPIGKTPVVAERMRQRLADSEIRLGGVPVRVTASFGIAGSDSLPDDGILSPDAFIERADQALYAAKNHGRNCIEIFQQPSMQWPSLPERPVGGGH